MARFGVKEVADVSFYNLLTGKADLFLDTLKMSNLENNAEQSFASGGKNSPRLVGWDFNRTATFNIQDALLNPRAISMQVGTEIEKKKEKIYKRINAVAVSDNGGEGGVIIELGKIPVAGSVQVYETTDGYDQVADLTEKVTVVGEQLKAVDVVAGTKVIVYFQFETVAEAEVITIKSDKFSAYYKVVGDTLWRNEATGNDEMVQIVIPKAKITSAFTITMQPDGEPSVFDFNLDVFKDPASTDMVKLIRYVD